MFTLTRFVARQCIHLDVLFHQKSLPSSILCSKYLRLYAPCAPANMRITGQTSSTNESSQNISARRTMSQWMLVDTANVHHTSCGLGFRTLDSRRVSRSSWCLTHWNALHQTVAKGKNETSSSKSRIHDTVSYFVYF